MQMQLEKEKVFQMAAERMTGDRILIVCDRGLLDNKVYMNNLEFRTLMRDMGLTETEIRDQYDAIFHLSTAAKGAGILLHSAQQFRPHGDAGGGPGAG